MVVSSRLRERDRLGAGVEQREAAGAVGRFHHAGREAALPDRRRLLVAGDAEDADRPAEQIRQRSCRSRRRSRAPRGSSEPGTPNSVAAAPRPSRRVRISNSSVRAALVASVACTLPPVSRQSRKLSTVPKASRPGSGRRRARRRRGRAARRSWWRRNTDRAAARCVAAIAGSWPAARSAAQASAVRRSCQTMALWIGLPVARSQTIVVSRWLVMPIAAMSLGADAGLRHRVAHGRDRRRPDLLRIVLDPARRRIDLARTPAARSRPARARHRTRSRASRWCPGRWRGDSPASFRSQRHRATCDGATIRPLSSVYPSSDSYTKIVKAGGRSTISSERRL